MPENDDAWLGGCDREKEVTLVPESVVRIRADFTYDDAHTRVPARRS